ncbi:EpsG family protein [Hymenobacter sp. BT770]|uniref:EpsG family protein n=1 Tax=Hymenobacter sp. BT770 TaxID=2886942 RepID=UPI001D11F74B|nr:EpsG family protein [Hymenobacter sp. BT770]MCC3152806.1 EpsG family protein [Hymenobacter sp. BT770]MDO3414881.1 EpsG family protein [Hymenobacter sp. BT770]
MTEPGTYIFYTLLMGFMILLALPSVQAVLNENEEPIAFPSYWGPNLLFLIAAYSLIIGCRYYVGIDYKAYLEWYLKLRETGVYPRDIEFGYRLLNEFLNYLHAHYAFLFIIIAFIQILFLFKSLAKFPFLSPWFIYFFFTYLLMFSSMNIMRQTLAWFVFFYSLNLAFDKKYGWALLWLLFGYSFHKSILVGALFFPLLRWDWFKNRYVQIGLLLFVTAFAPAVLAFVLKVAGPLASLAGYEYYVDNLDYMQEISDEGKVGAGTARALFFILDFIIIWFSQDLKENFKQYDFYKYYNLYFLGALLERLVYDNFILARTNDYLLNFRVLILSFLCFFFFHSRTQRMVKEILGYAIALMMVAFFYRAIYNSAAETSPFRFLLLETTTQERSQNIEE